MKAPRILSVRVEHEIDGWPDTSVLGRYTDEREEDAIDRQERGDMLPRQYRYFVPISTGNPDSPEQDYQRMESLERGEWHYVIVTAKAKVVLVDSGPTQIIKSSPIMGAESDSDLTEEDKESLADLAAQLAAIGFDEKEIDSAVSAAKTVDV